MLDVLDELRVIETRFGGEYVVLSVPLTLEALVVTHLLACIADSKRLQNRAYAEGEPLDADALARELEPSYGLIEILRDGSAVRRVVPGSRPMDSGVSFAVVALILILATFATIAAAQRVWRSWSSWWAYETVTTQGAEAVVAADTAELEEVADEEVPVREKTVEPKWDEVLVEEGS